MFLSDCGYKFNLYLFLNWIKTTERDLNHYPQNYRISAILFYIDSMGQVHQYRVDYLRLRCQSYVLVKSICSPVFVAYIVKNLN